MSSSSRSLLRGALVGGVAGLVAAYVMERAQDAFSRAGLQPASGGDPATVKLAERLAGHAIAEDDKPAAGAEVHYGFGGLLGMIYGVAAEVEPRITTGFGLPYGAAAALAADEVGVPLLGLSGPPWESPAAVHAYSMLSHLIFGGALEAARRVMARLVR